MKGPTVSHLDAPPLTLTAAGSTAEPTRAAALKWVVVLDDTLPRGRQVNAAVCIAAATGVRVEGLLGPDATDADGHVHPGLPWAGVSILGASGEQIAALRDRVNGSSTVLVVDMPEAAQTSRVYDEYRSRVAETASTELNNLAIGLIGPRTDVDKLVKRLPLLD
ncbi:MAG: DUF2000 domain-containing protein [Glaciihabitans sp.]